MSPRTQILISAVLLTIAVTSIVTAHIAYSDGYEAGQRNGYGDGWRASQETCRLMLRDSAEKAVQGHVDGTEELIRLYNAAETEK